MVNAAVVPELVKAGKSYARDVSALITAGSTTEASYYPAIKAFVAAALAAERCSGCRQRCRSLHTSVDTGAS